MAKAIREADGKALLFKYFRTLLESEGLGKDLVLACKTATVTADTDFSKLVAEYPWLDTEVGPRNCFAVWLVCTAGMSESTGKMCF